MVLVALSLVLGLIVGSFLNVVIYRVPRRTFFSSGRRSRCPGCGAQIASRDNIPVISWLVLKGKARCCGAPISIRYPIVELLTGAAFVLASLGRSDALLGGPSIDGTQAALLALDFYLVAALIAASVIDIEHRILPDVINFLGIGVGLVAALLLPSLHASCWLADQVSGVPPAGVAVLNAALGCATGAGSLYLIGAIGKAVYRTEAMGLGDVKFMAFTGCFIGPEGVFLALLVACIFGALIGLVATIRTGDPLIPFGPFLAAGVLVAHFAREAAGRLLLEEWPAWLRESQWGLPILLAASLASLVALLYLRHRRRSNPGRLDEKSPDGPDANRDSVS